MSLRAQEKFTELAEMLASPAPVETVASGMNTGR